MMANGNRDGILHEIERLKADKEELEKRISLLEAQLSNEKSAASTFNGGSAAAASDCGNGLTPDMIYRYSRHLLLPNFGVEGQRSLSKSSILVVGAGGLGSPVALYLAACGVGITVSLTIHK